MTQVSITSAALSDVGHRRHENQDNYLVSDGLFLVADGMGGGVSGQAASATALDIMGDLTTVSTRTREAIDTRLFHAQEAVRSLGEQQAAVAGTTLTGLILKDISTLDADKNSWYVVNVGDSRTYHLSAAADGTGAWDRASFLQITHDHSERQEAIDSGRMLPQVASQLVPRNIITQAIGSPHGIDPDYFRAGLEGRFVICSDGVHSELTDSAIAEVVSRHESAEESARHLLDAALAAGGRDNITVIIVDVLPVACDAESTTCNDAEIPAGEVAGTDAGFSDGTGGVGANGGAGTGTGTGAGTREWKVSTIGPGEDIDSMNDSTLETLRTTQAQNSARN